MTALLLGVAALIGTLLATYVYFGGYWYLLSQLSEKPGDDE